MIKNCANCNKSINVKPCRVVSTGNYCSKTCSSRYLYKIGKLNGKKCTTKAHSILKIKGHYKRDNSYLKGENNHSWKGGVTPKIRLLRKSKEYELWRKSVFERDNYTCVFCGIKSKKGIKVIIHADHIKPFAFYPELRFAIDNGRTLCVKCHLKTDTYGNKAKKHTIKK
jgi:hypothetical protein